VNTDKINITVKYSNENKNIHKSENKGQMTIRKKEVTLK